MKLLFSLFAVATMLSTTLLAAEGPVRHIVSFKFKSDADPAKIKKIEEDFAALPTKIDFIETLEWGTDISKEKKAKGFTHCWIVSFKNEKDRDAYIIHPDHQLFVKELKEVLEDAFVFDFIPKK